MHVFCSLNVHFLFAFAKYTKRLTNMYSLSSLTLSSISRRTSEWNQRNWINHTDSLNMGLAVKTIKHALSQQRQKISNDGSIEEDRSRTTPSSSLVSLLWLSEIWIKTSPAEQTHTYSLITASAWVSMCSSASISLERLHCQADVVSSFII